MKPQKLFSITYKDDMFFGEWLYFQDGKVIKKEPIKDCHSLVRHLQKTCGDKIYKFGIPANK